jgi:hypothetical protein
VGEDLLPLFMSLAQWGDTYLQDGPAPLSFVDTDTGRTLAVRVTPKPTPRRSVRQTSRYEALVPHDGVNLAP